MICSQKRGAEGLLQEEIEGNQSISTGFCASTLKFIKMVTAYWPTSASSMSYDQGTEPTCSICDLTDLPSTLPE